MNFLRFLLLVCSSIGFLMGATLFFKKGKALFAMLITCSLGCTMLGYLYEVVQLVFGKGLDTYFQLGRLGSFGGFLFLFSACFGQMDALADDQSKKLNVYRWIAVLAPVSVTLIYCLGLKPWLYPKTLILIPEILVIESASYFHLKHLIIPDVEDGILKSIRPLNGICLLMCFTKCFQVFSYVTESMAVWTATSVMLCLIYLVLIPVTSREVKKWSL